jgi:hypothetical protein
MDDARLRESKDLAQRLTAALVRFEKLLYRIEDVLLFHHPRRAWDFFIWLNISYILLYLFLRRSTVSVLLLITLFVGFRPSQQTIEWSLRFFISQDILRLGEGRKRFHIGQMGAFLAAVWYFVRWCGDRAIHAAKNRDLKGITTAYAVLGTILYFTWIIPEGVIGLVALNGALLLPYLLTVADRKKS